MCCTIYFASLDDNSLLAFLCLHWSSWNFAEVLLPKTPVVFSENYYHIAHPIVDFFLIPFIHNWQRVHAEKTLSSMNNEQETRHLSTNFSIKSHIKIRLNYSYLLHIYCFNSYSCNYILIFQRVFFITCY